MWIFTRDGFYSVVQDRFCKPSQVVVRARNKKDLERLIKKLDLPKEPNILTFDHSDYLHRILIPRKAWAKYVFEDANDIKYRNFKNQACMNDVGIAKTERHHAMMRIWGVMADFQDKLSGFKRKFRMSDEWLMAPPEHDPEYDEHWESYDDETLYHK